MNSSSSSSSKSVSGASVGKARAGSRRTGIKTLSIAEKLMVIERAEAGESPHDLQREYGIKKSTYYGFLKDREKIRAFAMGQVGGGFSQRKYVSKGKYLDLEKVVLSWYRQQRAMGMNVEGVELQRLAEAVARTLGLQAFSASTGWLFRFRTRHGILNRNYIWNPTPEISFDELPKEGLTGGDDRGSSEYSQNDEEAAASGSPEFLGDGSEQDPTPAPAAQTPPKPESYQLRHNNHLTIVLEALARDEAFMDVTLTAQGRSLKAHKSVLSAVSPYFRGVLRENPCQHPIIIMPRDVRFEELFSIVNYIYKGEMTVAAEDLTSLLKTAEILQVSGLAPSDSSATVNPHTAGNIRSSSSSSSASSNVPPVSKAHKNVKETNQGISAPVTRPKSPETMINPSDFMDMDMTYVKEEIQSGGEDDDDTAPSETNAQPSRNISPKASEIHQDTVTFTSVYNQNQEQTTEPSNSSQDTSSIAPIKTETEKEGRPDLEQIKSVIENPQPFICPHCQGIHRGLENMNNHLRLNHPTKPSFTCACGRVFTRSMSHLAHIKVCNVPS
ncbi:protein abrupt-like isoform X3 [Macrobrachium rosenbergii]|uniref:protein abrupt-like isoform X3 n=1 Tax=Macrobrachium rosenbergii TaxID=79674 RepID=UPI0034D3A35C